MISINATLVLQVIQFLVLVFILNRLMIQPTLKLIREREGYVERTKQEIKDMEEETENIRTKFVHLQNVARRDASHERTSLRIKGAREVDRFVDETRAEVQSIKTAAENAVEKEIEQTKPLLSNEAAALAGEIIEKVIGRRVEA